MSAFQKIKEGLDDALRWVKGDRTAGREHRPDEQKRHSAEP